VYGELPVVPPACHRLRRRYRRHGRSHAGFDSCRHPPLRRCRGAKPNCRSITTSAITSNHRHAHRWRQAFRASARAAGRSNAPRLLSVSRYDSLVVQACPYPYV